MSKKSDVRQRSENSGHASGSYIELPFLDDENSGLSQPNSFLDNKGFAEDRFLGALWPPESDSVKSGSSAEERETSRLFSGTLEERIALLAERIKTLHQEVARRRSLHRAVQGAIRLELNELGHLLRDVKIWSLGVNPSVDSRRTNLEREAVALKKASWEEKLRHWRDIVWLEKELQEAIEKYKLTAAAEGLTEKQKDGNDG